MYGRLPRYALDFLREEWEDPGQEVEASASYLEVLRRKLRETTQIAQSELREAQGEYKWRYDATVRPHTFEKGQKVLLLLSSSQNKLLVQWQGPYMVEEKVGDVNYRIQVPNQGLKLCHVNLLKEWQEEDEPGLCNAEIDWDEEGKDRSRELQHQIVTELPASAWQLHQIQQVLGGIP